jgi:hypothetical protein
MVGNRIHLPLGAGRLLLLFWPCLRPMFDGSQAGQPDPVLEAAMTTGTALVFIFIGVIGPAALVGAIWLEQRMPEPQPQHITAPSPGSAPPGQRAAQPPPGPAAPINLAPGRPYGRHHR